MFFYFLIVYQRTLVTTGAPYSICAKSSKPVLRHIISILKRNKWKYISTLVTSPSHLPGILARKFMSYITLMLTIVSTY